MSAYHFSYGVCLVSIMILHSSAQRTIVVEVTESASVHCSSECCEQNSSYIMCSSIDQLPGLLKNMNVSSQKKVFINCTSFTLRRLVMFKNIKNMSFYGRKETTIECESSDEVVTRGAGLAFNHASNVLLSNLTFAGCGGLHKSTSRNMSSNDSLHFKGSLYFECCKNVTVSQVTVMNSSGLGLVFYDSTGLISIKSSIFESNFLPTHFENDLPGGGGVYIEFTPCSPGRYSTNCSNGKTGYKTGGQYMIQRCDFKFNRAHSLRSYIQQGAFRTFGQGGGLLISLRGSALKNNFTIKDCTFMDNTALWGGGLHLLLMDSSKENAITVVRTLFEGNVAKDGGGAIAIYITSKIKYNVHPMSGNLIKFERCNISNNSARQGGGMIIFVSIADSEGRATNRLEFSNTDWIVNTAKSSAAIDITAKDASSTFQGPFPTFINCKFYRNKVCSMKKALNSVAVQSHYGKATFLITLSKVFFNKSVEFCGNNGTALHLSSSVASFSINMDAKFEGNYVIRGGAIALIASSYLELRENSCFNFTSNHAFVKGGAIYSYSIGEHELYNHILSLGCFIQHRTVNGNPDSSLRDRFIFMNNDVIGISNNFGHSIFSTSLLACASDCHGDYSVVNASTALSCVGNFTFINSSAESQVSTAGSEFLIFESIPLKMIPGKKVKLQISVIDALNNTAYTILRSYIIPTNNYSRLAIDSRDRYITDNTLVVYGNPGARGTIHLEKVGYHTVDLSFNIQVIPCPPGYILFTSHVESVVTDQCICAWSTQVSYRGIIKCNHSQFQAYIQHGIWAGYGAGNESEDNLFTAYCPLNFCSYNESMDLTHFYLLPGVPNRTQLSHYICSQNRTGWLCGSCVDGYLVYFHSPTYSCGPDKTCSFGPLLYFLSELLPLTLLFTAILILRVNFTSGSLTGFIFFSQVIDFLLLDVNFLIGKSSPSCQWSLMLNWLLLFVYRSLNLNFFAINSLSFCLWKSATTLDIIASKYLTIAFAFFLVLATYLLMNRCNVYQCNNCKAYTRFTRQSSIIHGISTFLVMCFAQCVQVSFLLLTPGHVYGRGGKVFQSRLLYHGEVSMYSLQHVRYAAPAFICIIVFVVLPTVLLLWYPSGSRLLSFCSLRDNVLIMCLNKLVPLHKLKPFFDSFQSCFRDHLRFFSGLYFSYRIILIAAYTLSVGITQFYILVEMLLITMLMLHALAQPYKTKVA